MTYFNQAKSFFVYNLLSLTDMIGGLNDIFLKIDQAHHQFDLIQLYHHVGRNLVRFIADEVEKLDR